MKSQRLVTIPAAALLALGVGLGVSACNPLAAVTEQAAEKAIEDATGGSVDIDAGGGVSLPEDFPADVPLIDAKLFSSTSNPQGDGQQWIIIYTVDDPDRAYKDAVKLLTEAGYKTESSTETAEGSFGSFNNGTRLVMLTAAATGSSDAVLSYTVTVSTM